MPGRAGPPNFGSKQVTGWVVPDPRFSQAGFEDERVDPDRPTSTALAGGVGLVCGALGWVMVWVYGLVGL